MSRNLSDNLVNLLVLAILPVSILAHAVWLPRSVSVPAIEDSGYVSIITLTFVACVFVSQLTLIFNSNLASSKLTAGISAYVIAIYFLREADFHRLFTIEHVTRGKFYTMEVVPLWQKIFAGIIFFILAICLLYLLIKYIRLLWSKIKSLEPWAISLLLWFIVLVISQLCDRSGLNHTHFGRVVEENCECWAAIFLFLTVIQLIPTLKLKNINIGAKYSMQKNVQI